MSEEIIWVNLVPNENKSADNHPDWVAPPNPNAPEGKEMDHWYKDRRDLAQSCRMERKR
jgi:uncharacterized protein (DUF736 family)